MGGMLVMSKRATDKTWHIGGRQKGSDREKSTGQGHKKIEGWGGHEELVER